MDYMDNGLCQTQDSQYLLMENQEGELLLLGQLGKVTHYPLSSSS